MNFVWTLILSPWVGLVVLILYDATKNDGNGRTKTVAAGNFKMFIERIALMARTRSPAAVSSLDSLQKSSLVGQTAAAAAKKEPRRKDGRVSATIPDLELAITEAVKTAAPECKTFVGVVLQKTHPRSRRDANWQLRGIKFGQADRKIATEALVGALERMQRGFYIGER
jgi:hypothetical protein